MFIATKKIVAGNTCGKCGGVERFEESRRCVGCYVYSLEQAIKQCEAAGKDPIDLLVEMAAFEAAREYDRKRRYERKSYYRGPAKLSKREIQKLLLRITLLI